MTLSEFLEKFNGEFVEVAGSPGAINQCVDLANAYIRDVLGQPIIEWTNAIDFPSKAGDKYDYFLNTPTGIPKEGDLIIFGGTKVGHISIFIEGNADTFRSLDQNYPTGSNTHVQNHNYLKPPVLGWLRFKGQIPNTSLEECRVQLEQEITKKNETYSELQEVKNDLDGVKKQQEFLDNVIKQYANMLGIAPDTALIAGEIQKFINIQDELRQKDKKIDELETAVRECNRLFEEKEEMYQESIRQHQADLKVLHGLEEKYKGLEGIYNKLHNAYEDLKEDQKFNYKHLIFGLYIREVFKK